MIGPINRKTLGLAIVAIAMLATTASAQSSTSESKSKALSPELADGKALFAQRCGVCHSTARKVYGPMLTKDVVIDHEDTVKQQIEQGSTLMPGFRYGLKPAQIDSIIAYLRTVEPPARRVGTNNSDIPD
jgi:mono/diheme cytochrome c family protein